MAVLGAAALTVMLLHLALLPAHALAATWDTPTWTVAAPYGNDGAGQIVANAGDVDADGFDDVLIGAYGCSPIGSAYLYRGSATGISADPAAMLTSPDPGDGSNTYFGYALAGAGDVDDDGYGDVVVSSYFADDKSGAVYVYPGSPTGIPSAPTTTLTGTSDAYLGWSVAGAGDVDGDGYDDVIVGAPGGDGSAILYPGSPTGLSGPSSTAVGDAEGKVFGRAVSSAGDVDGDGYADVVVGDYNYGGNTGRVYVYAGSAMGVSASATTTLSGLPSSEFGYSVASAGDVDADGFDDVLVGGPLTDSETGMVALYRGSSTGTESTAAWTKRGAAYANQLGYAVAGAGDVNDDGYADVVVGQVGGWEGDPGGADVYTGSEAGLGATPAASASGEGVGLDYFGWSVAGASDVNGDGFDDVIVGAPYEGPGATWVYDGSASADLATAATVFGTSDAWLGGAVADAGDVNGDGYDDALVGAYGWFAETGEAFLYLGGPTGLAATAAVTLTGAAEDDDFGSWVASAGDVNGDGFDDVIVSAVNRGEQDSTAMVYLGSATGLATAPATTIESDYGSSDEGYFLYGGAAGLGDLDGDGFDEVAVASEGADLSGNVQIHYGSAAGTDPAVGATLTMVRADCPSPGPLTLIGDADGDGSNDLAIGCGTTAAVFYGPAFSASTYLTEVATSQSYAFGSAIAAAGDVNGDGYADLAVGDYLYNTDPSVYPYSDGAGAVLVFLGSADGIRSSPAFILTGPVSNAYFGSAVAGGADLTGDGYDDVVVGAYGYAGTGALFVYPGSATGPSTTPSITIDGTGSTGLGAALALGDYNHDTLPDILAGDPYANHAAGAVSLYQQYTDADADGLPSTVDCDDTDPTVTTETTTSYADLDGDGYGDPDAPTEACGPTDGVVLDNTDCDDTSAATNPGAPETCDDGVDQDCDGADLPCDTAGPPDSDSASTVDCCKATPCGCAVPVSPTAGGSLALVALLGVVRRRAR